MKGIRKIESRDIAAICAKCANDKKALQIKMLDIGDLLPLTDYFLLLTCTSRRHVQALAEDLRLLLKNNGYGIPKIEGVEYGGWVLIDAGYMVIHLFDEKSREFYDLDNLWADASEVDWESLQIPLPEGQDT